MTVVTEPNIVERFPMLRRLESSFRKKRIPIVRQMTVAECGAACLAMVASYHGRSTSLEDARELVGGGRHGTSALSILKAGRQFGLRGRGVKVEAESLRLLSKGAILYWEFNHFLVLDHVDSEGIHVIDPAVGRRRVRWEKVFHAFTGVALEFEPSENFKKTRGVSRSSILHYISTLLRDRKLISQILWGSTLLQFFGLAMPLLTGVLVDKVIPRADQYLLWIVFAGAMIMTGLSAVTHLVRSYLFTILSTRLSLRMTLGFLEHLIRLPFAFFHQRSNGDLLMRLNSNVQIREIVTSSTLSAILDGALIIGYIAVLFWGSATMGLITLCLGLVRVLLFVVTAGYRRELLGDGLEAQARSQGHVVQMLAGIETLKSVGAEDRALHRWTDLFVDELNVRIKQHKEAAWFSAATHVLDGVGPLTILGFGGWAVMSGELSLGTMLALNALALGVRLPLSRLVSSAVDLQLVQSFVYRIDDVLRHEPEIGLEQPSLLKKISGQIRLDSVSFRYHISEPYVLQNIDVSIQAGQTVALVGASGAGKSTLAKLLVGLYLPTDGKVLFDDTDLASVNLREIRSNIGVVTQHIHLFDSSVRDNIAIANPELTLDRVVEAAEQACIHDDIVRLSMGYETLIAEGGASLSGGQRQRLALARALVHQPAVLLLDEATSALDSISERKVQRALDGLRCTKIVIAHRLSTVVNADRILVLDKGRIAEDGTHETLLSKGGHYAELVSADVLAPDVGSESI